MFKILPIILVLTACSPDVSELPIKAQILIDYKICMRRATTIYKHPSSITMFRKLNPVLAEKCLEHLQKVTEVLGCDTESTSELTQNIKVKEL